MHKNSKLSIFLTALTSLFSALSVAQQAPDADQAQPIVTGDELVLEEVIVTATRRSKSVMEVPIAISAFNGRELQRRGIREVSELAQAAPSLFVVSNSSEALGTEVRIRGVGTSGNNPGLEASVGVFIDGIYRSRSGLATGDLLDVKSVEVLRGPQGTLFGRNTSAGAISIHSNEPEFDWGGYLEGGVGNYDSYALEGAVTGPLIENELAFRLAAGYRQRDGYIEDRLVDREFYDRDRVTAKGQLLWQPNETMNLRLIADYRDKKEQCCTADYVIAGPTSLAIQALGGIVKEEPFAYKAQTNYDSADEIDEWGTSLEYNWELDSGMRFTYLGAYRDADAYVDLDADTSNVDLVQGVDWDQTSDLTTHELRLAGVNGRIDWLVGAYFYDESIEVDWSLTYGSQFGEYFSLLLGGALPPSLFPEGRGDQSRYFSQEAEGWALFTHNILELNQDWDLVLGLRWSEDDKDAKSVIENDAIHCEIASFVPYCPVPGIDDSRSESEPTGTVKVVRNLDNGNLYASYARGYKAGGFNLDRDAAVTVTEFDPEIVDTFELGGKWTITSSALQISSALFYSEFQDFQIAEFTGVTFIITNAAEVSSTGAEVEISWLPTAGLTLNLGVTYAETEFDEHPGVNLAGDPLKGQQISHAPEWSGSASVVYEYDFSRTTAFAVFSAAYMGDHNTDPKLNEQTEVDSYTVVNGRLGLRTLDTSWEFSVWANNMFDEEYHQAIYDTSLQDLSWSSFRGEPRTYGATLRYEY